MTDPDLSKIDRQLARAGTRWRTTQAELDHQLMRIDPRQSTSGRRRGRLAAGIAALVAAAIVVPYVLVHDSETKSGPANRPTAITEQPQDGKQTTTELTEPLVRVGQGNEVIQLGPAPAGTTAIKVDLACLTPGKFYWEDGASLGCNAEDIEIAKSEPRHTMGSGWTIDWTPGKDFTSIKAGARQRWRAAVSYVSIDIIPWGRNAAGQTYGTPNDHGMPDLVATQADNGRWGYVYVHSPMRPSPGASTPPSPHMKDDRTYYVYESDGTTRIGEFTMGQSVEPPAD